MSDSTYTSEQQNPRKPVVWLRGAIKTPPFSKAARIEAGRLLAKLQDGESLGMPHSRPMPSIGARCHELRIRDSNVNWRIVYRLDVDAILVVDVFAKKGRQTQQQFIKDCRSH